MAATPDVRKFNVKFAGVVPEISGDIDPSGRTDLLKIIDAAELKGVITILGRAEDFAEDAEMEIDCRSVTIRSAKETLLVVPLHMIVSVGLVIEESLNILPLKIGEVSENTEIFDLAVVYIRTEGIAEEICEHLDKCFQFLFHEAMSSQDFSEHRGDEFPLSNSSPSVADIIDGSNFPSITEAPLHKRHHPSSFSVSTGTSVSSKNSLDLINEYLTMLSACLSHEELNRFALLLKRWRAKEMAVLEFAQKLMELYGAERKHLLAKSQSKVALKRRFSGQRNGSPPRRRKSESIEPQSSASDESTAMSNSAAVSGGDHNHHSKSPSGFRGLFNKLRKPSDHHSSSMHQQVQIGSRVYDSQEIQKLIPQLEEAVEKKDRLLRQAQQQIETQQSRITKLEADVKSLQTECDKLRSVLSQKAENVATPPASKTSRAEELHTDLQNKAVLPTELTDRLQKKVAVSAEPAKLDQHKTTLQHHPKSAGSKQLIRDAVQKSDFLRQFSKEQVIELVECMFEMRARAGQWIIQEGEPGDRLFVVAEGKLQASREGQQLGVMNPGTVVGELAILYNCTRTASVQAITDVVLWVLDRSVFQLITMRLGMERHTNLMNFLHKVAIFESLSEDRISKMADVMDQDYYAGGHHIIREGEKGDTFFIINSGQVRVTQTIEGEAEPREIRILKQGDFFGEKALLGEEVRTANIIAMNPGVEVLTLDRESFSKLIGNLEALKKDYGDLQRRATHTARSIQEAPSPTKVPEVASEFASLQLRQLKRIATLGVGGFGRVELVCINGDKTRTFALKALKKKHIVDTRQQEHIFAERNIMLETKTDWIVQLFTTFRDSKYVYMLLEACLGGELWTTLRDRGHFDDYTARFYVACVLEGLEYLHHKSIVYRDLKPENCLLTTSGYLKLVDFGFAKKLASGRKTWTFCGTPEYVSPEIILNKGHDQAADYWALGIYICELMLGRPPFQASDPMKTYTLILKGIDALEIPNRRIGKTATALVKKLCRDNPGERLGSGSGGVNDIRKHRWFMGFDWEGLRTRTLKPPILPKVSSPSDTGNFDNYPPDQDIPPDEFSGWDEGF